MKPKPQKPYILIVDDVQANIKVLGETLLADYEIRFATNGPEALTMAGSVPSPDLILLDIMMPEMDGHEVCRRLKSDKMTKDIPVIFLTAKMDGEDEITGFDLGAVDYITKPFNPKTVQARVRTHIELKQHRDRLDMLVEERTDELTKTNSLLQEEIEKSREMTRALKKREKDLEEANVALKVVLKRVNEDREELEKKVLANVNEVVMPYLEKMKGRIKGKGVECYLKLIESHLNEIISPFARKLTTQYRHLTRTEIEVADLIRNDKSTKEIAEMLHVSEKTVEFHRNNIRKKLGIKNRKINLKTHLMSLQQP